MVSKAPLAGIDTKSENRPTTTYISTLPFCITPTQEYVCREVRFMDPRLKGKTEEPALVGRPNKGAVREIRERRPGRPLGRLWGVDLRCQDPTVTTRLACFALRSNSVCGVLSETALTIPITVPYSWTSSARAWLTNAGENSRAKKPRKKRPKPQLELLREEAIVWIVCAKRWKCAQQKRVEKKELGDKEQGTKDEKNEDKKERSSVLRTEQSKMQEKTGPILW